MYIYIEMIGNGCSNLTIRFQWLRVHQIIINMNEKNNELSLIRNKKNDIFLLGSKYDEFAVGSRSECKNGRAASGKPHHILRLQLAILSFAHFFDALMEWHLPKIEISSSVNIDLVTFYHCFDNNQFDRVKMEICRNTYMHYIAGATWMCFNTNQYSSALITNSIEIFAQLDSCFVLARFC